MNLVSPLSRSTGVDERAVEARRWHLTGRVQGVGFRPFVYRLACQYHLAGWVCNHGGELDIHVESSPTNLNLFRSALGSNLPPGAVIAKAVEVEVLPEAFARFSIRPSRGSSSKAVYPPPDLSICNECVLELNDEQARRYRYPFVNCAQCGPRFSLLQSMPYDRDNTTMSEFQLCHDCLGEYANPFNRRHHAQPLACARCGPSLSWSQGSETIGGNQESIAAAVAALREEQTIAVRGIGGYHLLCSARSTFAVRNLRLKKNRPTKPFAILVPSVGPSGLNFARSIAELSVLEEDTLVRPDRPIVIVRQRPETSIVDAVAPNLNEIGVMLPYSPLLHLLLDQFDGPLVATSGNISGEPILSEPVEAELHLSEVATGFLHHNRAIARAADDSVVRIILGCSRPIRLGRGSSPVEMDLRESVPTPTLAVGALQKNTIALAWGDRVAISPHIGDFISVSGRDTLLRTIADFESLYGVRAERLVYDAHPAMRPRHLGRYGDLPARPVWHHFAHASAIAGEFATSELMLCFTWDANGFGQDQTLWGGEALLGRPGDWTRVASFRPFPLLGGDLASRQPWRCALGLCWEAGISWSAEATFSTPVLRAAHDQRINCPRTSAVGRLFDAAASLLGICSTTSFSAEAAMRIEALCPPNLNLAHAISLPLISDQDEMLRTDWEPLLLALLDETRSAESRAMVFHASLALAVCDQAKEIRRRSGVDTIGLGGGVFQNRVLTELVERSLIHEGFRVRIPVRFPVNDASISFGQIIEATAAGPRRQIERGLDTRAHVG
jgi:hydrogenase maturation protein HypF